MTYVLRSVFKRLLFKSIDISCHADRNAFLIQNCSFSRRMFSQLPYQNDEKAVEKQHLPKEEPNIRYNLSKQLVKLETDINKRGVVMIQDLNDILKILEIKKSLSNTLAAKLLLCCGRLLVDEPPLTRIQLVQTMWESFKEYGVEYNITHYNALLKVYRENNYPFNPDEVMKELKAKRLFPNADTYESFVARYSYQGDLVNTNRLLAMMREKNVPILVDVYCSLIICHSKNNNMEQANNIIDIVTKMEPDALPSVYTALIIEYIKKKDVEKALGIFDTVIPKHKYTLNEYFDILFELAINDYENEFYKELQEYKHPPNYNLKVPVYITKLIIAGKPEYGYSVLKTMHQLTRPTGTRVALGPFFVSNLVKYDVPCSVIVKLCLDMKKTKFNEVALEIAMRASLRLKNEKLALSLFHAAKSNNLPIRLHYFWPLLLNRAQNKDKDGIFYLMDIMYNNYNLVANFETLRFYIVPYIYSKTMDIKVFMLKFKPYGVTISTIVSSLVHYLLNKHEFKSAAEVAESYGASYPKNRFEEITVNLYVETKDSSSFIKLMKAYCMGCIWHQNINTPGEDVKEIDFYDHQAFFDGMVHSAVTKLIKKGKNGAQHVAELFQCMLENNITISSKKIHEIKGILFDHEQSSEVLSSLLEQLKLEKSIFKSMCKSETDDSSEEKSIERLYENMEASQNTSELSKKYLFNLYGKNHNLDKLLQLKEKLEAENYQLTDGMYAHIIDTLVEHKKWEDAIEIFRDQVKKTEDFRLDNLKMNRFVSLLVQNDRVEDAREILSNIRLLKMENPRRVVIATRVFREVLECLAKKGNVQLIEDFFKIYRTRGLGNVNEKILEPLVQVHLIRNDVESAFKKYMECVVRYNHIPCKKELMRALVVNGDKEKLTELITASGSDSEGETLYDLVIVYSELNKIEQARRVLQSRVLKLSRGGSERLTMAVEKYSEENNTKNLLNLLLATRDTKVFERDDLCTKILKACINTNDVETAQALWTEMQDENVVPSFDFLNSLAKLLKDNGIPVNFDHVMPVSSKSNV